MPQKDNRLLNVMRLVAALMVVAGHVRTSFFRDYTTEPHNALTAIAYALTALGNPAVLVFFALSGYWVGGSAYRSIIREKFGFGDYLLRRVVRLWIVLIPALVLTLIVDSIGMHVFRNSDIYSMPRIYSGVPSIISHSPITFFGNIAFLQNFFVGQFGYDMPLWSLSYEFWYYIAFPCVILLVLPKSSLRVRCLSLLGLGLAFSIGRMLLLEGSPPWLLGALAGAFPHALEPLRVKLGERAWGFIQAAGAVLLVVAMCVERSGKAGVLGVLALSVISALVILTMARDAYAPSRWLDLLSRLSHCTYSLYTTHMCLVVLAAAAIVPAFDRRFVLISPSGGLLFVMVAALFCVGWVFAQVTERKTEELRRWLIGKVHSAGRHQAGFRDQM